MAFQQYTYRVDAINRLSIALHATRAAVEEGVVPGGGVTLLYASQMLGALNPENNDQKVGIDIVRRALQAPARQIFENAGADPQHKLFYSHDGMAHLQQRSQCPGRFRLLSSTVSVVWFSGFS